jgi:hypothetical protein
MFIIFLSMLGCGANDCFLEVTQVSGERVAINKSEIEVVGEELVDDKKVTYIVTHNRRGGWEVKDTYDDIIPQLTCTK